MAQKLYKAPKKKMVVKKEAEPQVKKVVLVGTYAGDQLKAWPGYYPYPLSADDKIDAEYCKNVTEIWLFKGTKEPRYFAAECLGVKTRDELKTLGYPAKGKGHGDGTYLLFKIEKTYVPANASAALAASVESVIIRTKDFAKRSPKVAKQLKAYLESPDRKNGALAKQLPTIVTKLPPQVLRVCEAAVQMEFIFLYKDMNVTTLVKNAKMYPVQNKDLPLISLFSGAGGLDIGFDQAGFRTAVMVEFDPACCRTLRKNMPKTPVLEGDINQIPTTQILDAAGLKPLEAALVIGGPPCQSFSLAGKRMGLDDPRGKLVLEFIRVVREALPVGFVMENVRGLTNWEHGKALDAIINEAQEPIVFNGKTYTYNVKYKILNAADYGTPQFRERVFIVGNRLEREYCFPEKEYGPPDNVEGLKPFVTVRDAICGLPPATPPSEVALRVSGTIKARIEKHGY